MVSEVYIIGLGMGDLGTLTLAAREALDRSGLVIGSARLLEELDGLACERLALVSSADIARALKASDARVASVVMSGDVGFYSGATALKPLLEGMEVRLVPGVSSLSYLCARLWTPWQDVFCASAHGRECDVAGIVQEHRRSFFLTGGTSSVGSLCETLAERGLGGVSVWVGERLSYPDERITSGVARELAGKAFDPLAVMLVENEGALRREVSSPYLPDEAFERGSVPMTKEEVRELVVCKLRVRPADVVWDVGAGTGSVTVELARAAFRGQILSIERNDEALALIRRNAETFGLTNVRVVAGTAPEALAGLPAPDRVFVGGSSGRLEAILRAALAANPAARLCVAAITLETLTEALRCIRELGLVGVDIVQVSVARSHEVAGYHMMRAENPVYLVCAEGVAVEGEPTPAAEGRA